MDEITILIDEDNRSAESGVFTIAGETNQRSPAQSLSDIREQEIEGNLVTA